MSAQQSTAEQSLAHQTSSYGYTYWEWMAQEDPAYARVHIPLSDLSDGEGQAPVIKYREMVIIGILAFRGTSQEGLLPHMQWAIHHGATKRELLEALESAAVPGGGPTFATGVCAHAARHGGRVQERVREERTTQGLLAGTWGLRPRVHIHRCVSEETGAADALLRTLWP